MKPLVRKIIREDYIGFKISLDNIFKGEALELLIDGRVALHTRNNIFELYLCSKNNYELVFQAKIKTP